MLMETNYPAWQLLFNIIQGILTGVLFIYTRRVAKQKATEQRFKQLEDQIGETVTSKDFDDLKSHIDAGCQQHQVRTSVIERHTAELRIELEHLPTQKQFDELNRSILSLSGELRNTQGRLEGINRAVDLINELLINRER
jgi:hypothetical protein